MSLLKKFALLEFMRENKLPSKFNVYENAPGLILDF